ncbi:MAG: hypothetical protein Q8J64_04215 [Thermodesulfovibrionales bacterium]|nr:hypothetical protein [Thermodesulfovibrionales bacterium]
METKKKKISTTEYSDKSLLVPPKIPLIAPLKIKIAQNSPK